MFIGKRRIPAGGVWRQARLNPPSAVLLAKLLNFGRPEQKSEYDPFCGWLGQRREIAATSGAMRRKIPFFPEILSLIIILLYGREFAVSPELQMRGS
jgi:hypothetical protein